MTIHTSGERELCRFVAHWLGLWLVELANILRALGVDLSLVVFGG